MDRNDALKQFHDGGDAIADLIDDRPGVQVPTPDSDVPMVSRSLRLPLDLYQRVCAAANERGVGVTTLMRQFVEAGMSDLDDGAVYQPSTGT